MWPMGTHVCICVMHVVCRRDLSSVFVWIVLCARIWSAYRGFLFRCLSPSFIWIDCIVDQTGTVLCPAGTLGQNVVVTLALSRGFNITFIVNPFEIWWRVYWCYYFWVCYDVYPMLEMVATHGCISILWNSLYMSDILHSTNWYISMPHNLWLCFINPVNYVWINKYDFGDIKS